MGRRSKKGSPFRTILCQLMDNAGLSVREAAKIAAIPPSTLANWRAGANPDDHIALRRLSDHFGVTLGYMLTGQPDIITPEQVVSMQHAFEEGHLLFDGYAKITIQRLVPRSGKAEK